MKELLEINGVVCANDPENKITGDEFYLKFLDWLESQDLCFGGGTTELDK